jgi:hypothetical protein
MDRRIERLVIAAFQPYQIVIFISFISPKVYKAHTDTFGMRGINTPYTIRKCYYGHFRKELSMNREQEYSSYKVDSWGCLIIKL